MNLTTRIAMPLVIMIVLVGSLSPPGLAQEASSANYVMETSGVTMAGGRSESASYRVEVSVGLSVGGGEMSSAGYRAEVGIVITTLDSDGDGVSGADDLCPTEYSGCYDLDFDGCIDTPDADADSDGISAGTCDCDDADGQIWDTPGEVLNLLLADDAVAGTTLSWDAPTAAGGTMPRYDTIRSGSPTNFEAGVALCVESDDDSDRSAVDSGGPSSGGLFYYLVRAENGCASGSGPTGTSQGMYSRAVRNCS